MGEIATPKPDVHSSRRTMYHKPQKPPHSRAWAHPTAPHSRPLPAAPRPARTSPPASCAWGQLSRPHTTEHLTWLSGTRQEEGARGSSSTPAASRAGAPGGSGPLQSAGRGCAVEPGHWGLLPRPMRSSGLCLPMRLCSKSHTHTGDGFSLFPHCPVPSLKSAPHGLAGNDSSAATFSSLYVSGAGV